MTDSDGFDTSDFDPRPNDPAPPWTERDLFDENGARESDQAAERAFVGALLFRPHWISDDLRSLVQPDLFFSRGLARIYAGLLKLGGFAPEKGEAAEWLAGEYIDDATGPAAIGKLIAAAADVQAKDLEGLADRISEAGVRRYEAAARADVFTDGWRSSMGLVMWRDRHVHEQSEYDFLVEDVIPDRELTIIMGATQAGKSFLAFHLAMCIARAVPFFGKQILEPRPILWCAFEGGRGARGRMLAYEKHFGLVDDDVIPFAALTQPVDLWSNDLNVDALIKECQSIIRTQFGGRTPGALFVDTHNAATPGASEIDSEAVSKIRDRYKKIMHALGCAIIIIGHTNAMGKHRGNELLVNNVDTVITVTKKTIKRGTEAVQLRDEDKRDIRSVDVWKQREGETGHLLDFVLPAIETGIRTKFGKSRTSCVVTAPNWTAQAEAEANAKQERLARNEKRGIQLSDQEQHFFDVLWKMLKEHGEAAPKEFRLPDQRLVVHRKVVRDRFVRSLIPNDGNPINENTVKSRWDRVSNAARRKDAIGFEEPYFWWSGKSVSGVPGTFAQKNMFDAEPTKPAEFPDDEMRDFQ